MQPVDLAMIYELLTMNFYPQYKYGQQHIFNRFKYY